MVVYHGSKTVVEKPKTIINRTYKDFGYGFYCTNSRSQAERWARTKSKTSPVVSVFNCQLPVVKTTGL